MTAKKIVAFISYREVETIPPRSCYLTRKK